MNVQWEGVLPINKPAGWTSHDVVARMRRILKMKRIGHTGTLDPEVTGVLPLCVGRATRLVEYIQEQPKEYEAVLTLGAATDTEDASGQVVEQTNHIVIDEQQVMRIMASFVGSIEQIPPMYSAVKHDGKRLYELAREGREVERKPRRVTIYSMTVKEMNLQITRPTIRFRVSCSKGTYIRTLCVDLGRAMGYPAYMAELVRTSTGGISLNRCVTIEEAEQRMENHTLASAFIPPGEALSFMPKLTLEGSLIRRVIQGQAVKLEEMQLEKFMKPILTDRQFVRLYNDTDEFFGVFAITISLCLLQPVKVFLPQE